jgi:3-isopropylmalate/(R)-2-methylmalate dehydratase large subunit
MNTLFDKIWDTHVVNTIPGGPSMLYIDRHFCHEATSPQAFDNLRKRGIHVFRPEKTFCTIDHNIPTLNQDKTIVDYISRRQVETMQKNAKEFGLTLFDIGDKHNGIVHVIGPENGLSLPGSTIVCGDSHTSTHGAFGLIAFGIGTSEVEMVLASQCILQTKPKSMRITIDGELNPGVTAKDIILYIINKMSTGGATGYFIEYSGTTIESLSMEGRMTICNMSIEMGARGGMIAPDDKTFEYLKGREYAPKGEEWDNSISYWRTLRSENDAVFDREIKFSASDITPRITYGTNPGMNIDINGTIPLIDDIKADDKESFLYSLKYMGFQQGEQLIGHDIDYVFMGSCTNGRIEDFRAFANAVKDHHKADNVTAWLVPGSNMVAEQIRKEKLDKILSKAGFEIRQPGCSACLAMNGDKIPKDKYVVSTSNRNFIGRQGPGSRTILASPIVAAVAAITGKITNPNEILNS